MARWTLPDRVFFACGACHVLTHAFLKKYPEAGFRALWLKPVAGLVGNHIIATDGQQAFDDHRFSALDRLLSHTKAKANRWWPGWNMTLVDLPQNVLIHEAKSRTYPGLWLREPNQFLRDAMPRAIAFLKRFPPPLKASGPSQRRFAHAF
jgi:hypothetical protein